MLVDIGLKRSTKCSYKGKYMVKKVIKYIRDIALLNFFFLLRDRKTKIKVKLKDIEE